MWAGVEPHSECGRLEPNPLHFILREPFLRSIIKLRRARAFVRCHRLRVLKRTAIAEMRGDAGRPKRVIADRREDAGGDSTPADHTPGISLIHRLLGERSRDACEGIGEGSDQRPVAQVTHGLGRNAVDQLTPLGTTSTGV